MDVAYNQHSIRRKSRSSVNLNHLSLAPLTSKLPIRDSDECDLSPTSAPSQVTAYSYLQGKSAPTTPRLLSRSPGPTTARSASLSRQRGTDNRGVGSLLKSKSAVHLVTPRSSHYNGRHAASQNTSPTAARRSSTHPHRLTKEERSDSDWLLRCGSIISTETRESKGQAWLISRASSTSLAGMPNAEEEAFERELAREREELNGYQSHTHSRHASRRGSRRNSIHMDDDNLSSPAYSRFGSRSHSRVGSMNPGGLNSAGVEGRRSAVFVEDYFNSNGTTPTGIAEEDNDAESIAGPDFVNLDEELEAAAEEDNGVDDEAYVRKLVKGGNGGMGSWFGNVLGVKLFAVEEDGEESEEDEDTTTEGEDEAAVRDRRVSSLRKLEAANMADIDTSIPPPKPDEGGWHDAAWLLTLASKVLL